MASDIFESEIDDIASPTGTKVSMVGKHFYANIGESELSLSPGGKATELGAKLKGKGMLLAMYPSVLRIWTSLLRAETRIF